MGGDRRATEIRITLYGSDGRRYIWSRANPPANEWVEVRADMSMFRVSGGTGVPAAGIGVEAVAVVARYGPVSPYWSTACASTIFLFRRAAGPVRRGGTIVRLSRQVLYIRSHAAYPARRGAVPEREAGGVRNADSACIGDLYGLRLRKMVRVKKRAPQRQRG